MQDAPDLEKWITDYARARYGKLPAGAEQGWKVLLETVYGSKEPVDYPAQKVSCAPVRL